MKTSDVFIMLMHTLMHLQHVDGYGDLLQYMHVYNMIQIKLLLQYVQNGTSLYLGQLCQPFLHRTQILLGLCFFIGRWTLQTNVCGVGSGEAGCYWD